MENYDTYAYFFVSDFDCNHREVTRQLGFEPTSAHNRNDPLPSGRTRRRGSWHVVSPLSRETVILSDHVEALLPILEAHAESVAKIANQFKVGIQCVGYYTDAHPGFHFTAETISRVAALNLSIDFDLYCFCACETTDSDD